MWINIKLTDMQRKRLRRIRRAYSDHGLHYTPTEVCQIVLGTHAKEYIDAELENVEDKLAPSIRGRVMGVAPEVRA